MTSVSAQDAFQSHIRPTDPLTPEQQQRTFTLPQGFRIQLFASEPELQKPMNMAFDERGRLWVTGSVEYPYAAEKGKGRDSIRVLEDTDGDGEADKVTVFADDLNIPIGLYPYGNGVVVYSIPEILYLEDTDQDGKADRRTVLYGPLGIPRDTHGMQNAFRRGFDGWLYICHGFSNETVIRGRDGSEVSLQSGNTYRVRLDGSRVEQISWGQVNPFGSAWTPWGDLVTADCHSKPLTVLMRDGFYSSFGKPHDGLGFAPDIMSHGHGSTAISGVAYCTSPAFPEEYQRHVFVGNVMSSRVNHDALEFTGSSPRAVEQPDFLTTTDSWFRPVDLQFGPDGALYVADFYNRIIGHYEVPLTHPGRDRNRGRIWRISSVGDSETPPPSSLSKQSPDGLNSWLAQLESPDLTVRQLATDQLTDHYGADAAPPALRVAMTEQANVNARSHALWVVVRTAPGLIEASDLKSLTDADEPLLRTHVYRAIGELPQTDPAMDDVLVQGLKDQDPLARRAAAASLARVMTTAAIQPLLQAVLNVDPQDTFLRHQLRIALRNQLRDVEDLTDIAGSDLAATEIASISLGLPTAASASFLMNRMLKGKLVARDRTAYVRHIVKHLPGRELSSAIRQLRDSARDDEKLQFELLQLISDSLQRDQQSPDSALKSWSKDLAASFLELKDNASSRWTNLGGSNPWGLERRNCDDGRKDVLFISSLPGGETRTSTLRSQTFNLPESLSFYLCGHRGFPQNDPLDDNFVRLRLASDGTTLATTQPPRNDRAVKVTWSLKDHVGQPVFLEIVDGLDLTAYAWLAVSRFDPPVLRIPTSSPSEAAQRIANGCELVGRYGLNELEPELSKLLSRSGSDRTVIRSAAAAMARLHPNSVSTALIHPLNDPASSFESIRKIGQAFGSQDPSDLKSALQSALKASTGATQQKMAVALASSAEGGAGLIALVSDGTASARLLQDPNIRKALERSQPEGIDDRIEELTSGLPSASDRVAAQLVAYARDYRRTPHDAGRGRQVFLKNCATCHQIAGQGGLIGPQLDGIGGRGVARILEDMIDPNRNIDKAFQTTVLALNDGRVQLGLLRREEGENLILANQEGKEFSVAKKDVDERSTVKTSIMPANLVDAIPPTDFLALTSYLDSLKPAPPTPVSWSTTQIDAKFRAEGVAVTDVDHDGDIDVLTGEFWYEAPDWTPHEISTPGKFGDGSRGYSQCFACWAEDFDGDGWDDYLVVGFPGAPCHWYRNPRNESGHWERYEVWHSACNETPLFADITGDGKRELIMGWQPEGQDNSGQMAWFAPKDDPKAKWSMHPISRPSTADRVIPGTHRFAHGLGVGDLNNDGRTDVLCTNGWWEQPSDSSNKAPWRFHAATLGPACADMQVVDVDGDKQPDVISSSAHGFGIWWHEASAVDGELSFTRQDLFSDLVSQTHAMHMVDINGDQIPDLVTGKRWWAHGPKGDVGADQPAMLYWFEGRRGKNGNLSFIPRPIHSESGMGTQFSVADMNGDGLLDVITSNKRGVHVSIQSRRAQASDNGSELE